MKKILVFVVGALICTSSIADVVSGQVNNIRLCNWGSASEPQVLIHIGDKWLWSDPIAYLNPQDSLQIKKNAALELQSSIFLSALHSKNEVTVHYEPAPTSQCEVSLSGYISGSPGKYIDIH